MKLTFNVTYELEVEKEHLLGDSPTAFLKASMEEDPALLLDNATITNYVLKNVTEDEAEPLDEDFDEVFDD